MTPCWRVVDVRLLERVEHMYRVTNNMMPSSRVVAMTEFLGSFTDWLNERQATGGSAGDAVDDRPEVDDDEDQSALLADLDTATLMRFAAIKYSADQYRARGEIPTDLLWPVPR